MTQPEATTSAVTKAPKKAKKIVIVGGVAGGASAAARARRLSEDAEIIIFERDRFISFANCGLPYHIGGEIKERAKLLVQTPESMGARFNLDVRIETEVTAIHADKKTVSVHELGSGKVYEESYDELILSPGAVPFVPPIAGVENSKVFTLRNIPDMDNIIRYINVEAPRSAVVVGGGFIGIEMAEALIHRGIETTLLELSNQVLGPLDAEMATPLHTEMRRNGVRLKLGQSLSAISEGDEQLTLELSDGKVIDTDMVIMAIGVRPETSLIRGTDIKLGERGGIAVDAHMRTSVANIWAVGDAIEVKDFVSQQMTTVPLAGPANRQGRIVAENIFGRDTEYKDTQGTSICKVFNLAAASTGQNEKNLKRANIAYEKIYVHAKDHAGYYPGATQVSLKLLFDPQTGSLLGAQSVGEKGVDKRIDVLALAIRSGLTVFDLEESELCYAPPFGSAKDVINQAGFVAANVIRQDMKICQAERVLNCSPNMQIVDVRSPQEIGELGAIDGAINIPVNQLRKRLDELPRDKNIVVYCAVGLRGYVAYRMLVQHGFNVKNLTGGYTTYLMHERIGR
ncbi:FAD-dependent oxidoreductase [Agaribacterium haliotis]|uniref:FAD-dependent oxidoreductase n=1 Tax=Agaribacterium haliotis TaxID=2013869 RepID=UPI000BB54763|nr:FAD-dependent oxidoreductase [Agaribacterium haliotis]